MKIGAHFQKGQRSLREGSRLSSHWVLGSMPLARRLVFLARAPDATTFPFITATYWPAHFRISS